ncbi:hypothetical protein F7725_020047 [Dissostichus mawsoni]|uniref:Ubiquitin-like protease family profile domain-containing protein n=1 Tax=Dissostichus mawsoni TaxID=36200 RepID=A0A7J5YPY4_DISMA|nr:hypothetical protein F7725_020047 [Dissostichus mawsoni]
MEATDTTTGAFSLSGEEERIHDSGSVSIEEMNRQQPEETKSPSLRHFPSPDPLRTYENRTNNLIGPLSRLPPKRLSDVPEETSSSTPNRTNFCLQGIVLQGRTLPARPDALWGTETRQRQTTSPPHRRGSKWTASCSPVQRSQRGSAECERRVQQLKRKPLEVFCSFPSQVKAAESKPPLQPLCPTVYHTVCMKCKKPSEDISMFGAALLSSVTPRPPSGPPLDQSACSRASTDPPPPEGLQRIAAASEQHGGSGTREPETSQGKRAAAAHRHELNDPRSVSRLDSVSPRPADSAHSSPAPSGGRVEAAVKSAGEEEEMNADFFEDVNMKITIPRRSRMKDQFGNQPPEQFSQRTKKPKLSPDKCDSIILECRSVRIGTLRRMVTKPVVTTADECFRLRSQLNMNEDKTGEWYDCAGHREYTNTNGLVSKEQNFLDEILREIGKKNNLSDFPSDLPFEEANIRLVNYNKASKQKEDKEKPMQTSQGSPVTNITPLSPVAMATRTRMSTRQHSSYFEDDEEEMTDLQHTFSGPIIKLWCTPLLQQKEGFPSLTKTCTALTRENSSTTYLVLERLKKEDAQRIHTEPEGEEERSGNQQPANPQEEAQQGEDVDSARGSFQKDFIFVPINESAHWYLAVICFPGLNGPLFDQNPQSPAPSSALQSEESVPDSVSPDRPAPLRTLPPERERLKETLHPPHRTTIHKISVSYASVKEDNDPFSFSDDQSSCQDECSEDGTLPEDPLSSESASKLNLCRQYLEVEWEVRQGSSRCFGKDVMKGSSPRVPQQDNFSDCGNPIPSFHLPVNLSDWFPQQRMKTKREEIKQLILKIKERQEVDRKEVSASPRCPEVPETPQTPNGPPNPLKHPPLLTFPPQLYAASFPSSSSP